jgi:hypothetical protein
LVFKAVDKPGKIWHITVALLIVVHLQLNKNNYFNFAKARREKREKQRNAWVRARRAGRRQTREVEASTQESTSEREDAVDA